jgi:phage anti-repressor protein
MQAVTVYKDEKGGLVVNARDLHSYLEVKTHFKDWIQRGIETCELEEDLDYTLYKSEQPLFISEFLENTSAQKRADSSVIILKAARNDQKDYLLTLEAAKELAMANRGPRSKEVRRYFIECERQLIERRQKEEVERRENMTEVEILRENAKLTLRLADEIEKKQQLNDRISSGALFDKLNLVNDTRSVISIEDIRLNYFFGFSNLVIDQFLRYINHPKREMVVADRFPKNMYIDENLFEAAHRLWEECEKIKNKKYVELYHKSFIDRKAFMPIDIAKEVWGYGLT